MPRFARMSAPDGSNVRTVMEIIEVDSLDGRFHPEVAATFVSAPNAAVVGSTKAGSTWTHPEVVQPTDPGPVMITQLSRPHFKLQFTTPERLAITAAREYSGSDLAKVQLKAVLNDFFGIIEDPALTYIDLQHPATVEGVQYLGTQGLIEHDRVAEVLAGRAQD